MERIRETAPSLASKPEVGFLKKSESLETDLSSLSSLITLATIGVSLLNISSGLNTRFKKYVAENRFARELTIAP